MAGQPRTHKRETRRVKYPEQMGELIKQEATDFLRSVPLPGFEKQWSNVGMDEKDMRALEVLLMLNPEGHPIVKGSGGVRKLRFASARSHAGKRGGARVYYLYVRAKDIVFWLYIHTKKQEAQISEKGKKALKALVDDIRDQLA